MDILLETTPLSVNGVNETEPIPKKELTPKKDLTPKKEPIKIPSPKIIKKKENTLKLKPCPP